MSARVAVFFCLAFVAAYLLVQTVGPPRPASPPPRRGFDFEELHRAAGGEPLTPEERDRLLRDQQKAESREAAERETWDTVRLRKNRDQWEPVPPRLSPPRRSHHP